MPEPPRSPAGHRRYGIPHVERLNFVMRAREVGFAMGEIRSLLSLVDCGSLTCGDVERMGRHHLELVRAKIRDLQAIEGILAQTIARCTGAQTPDCPLLDFLNEGHCAS
jgi:MerR family transcriptional regulator, mercuric resistance operon regulatory protein